jgi:hypothetical protein
MMTEEDEAFNEIERQAKQRMEAVKYAHKAYSMSISTIGEELSKLLTESYDAGVKDGVEEARNATLEEVAQHIEKLKGFGADTVSGLAIYIREMKK